MKKLILEELKKFRASKFLIILSIARILPMIISSIIKVKAISGWPIAPMVTTTFLPTTFFFLYGIVVIKMIASEFENYVVGDAIRAGASRKQYFVAKCITIVIYIAVMELLMTLAAIIVPVFKYGISNFNFKNLGLFLLFYFVIVLLICVMSAVAMLISYACKHFGLATAVIFVLYVIVDKRLSIALIDYICGPLALIFKIEKAINAGSIWVLTGEFWVELIPSVIVGVAAVVASYIIFMKTEFASVEEKEAE